MQSHYEEYSPDCSGLRPGLAIAIKDGGSKKVNAKDSTKGDGPFICPACLSDAILRKCYDKVDHFAHHPAYTPTESRGMSALHKSCQNNIYESLTAKFPEGSWAKEREIKKANRRPDISGRFGKAHDSAAIPVVIEVQASSLTIKEIRERTSAYHDAECNLLWVIPLTRPLEEGEYLRPRAFEMYLHGLYYGRVYYWWEELEDKIMPVHWGTAYRYIEERSWFENGVEQTAGGYDKPFKSLKAANMNVAIDVSTMIADKRNVFLLSSGKKLPEARILIDKTIRWWNTEKEETLKRKLIEWSKKHEATDYFDEFNDFDEE